MALLLDLIVKVSLLMIGTGAAVLLMRRASAASRHMALTAALGAAVLLPAAKVALPTLPLFVLAAEPQPAPTAVVPSALILAPIPAAASDALATNDLPVTDARVVASTAGPEGPAYGVAAVPVWTLSRVLALIWLAGTAAILLNMALAIVLIRKLAGKARAVEDVRMVERLQHLKNHLGVRRPVALLVSQQEWMPITWGLVRPTILLPSSATSWLDTNPARLDAVLVHEMAHIARGDALAQRITRVAVALFWFNPLVWLAARRARLERERACDDAVLAHGLRATDYASDLLELAQTLVLPSRAAGVLAMARRSQLEQRVGALLDARISRRGASAVARLCAVALVLLMLPMAAAQLAARPLPPVPQTAVTYIEQPNVSADFPALEPLDVRPSTPVAETAPVSTNQTRPLSEGLRTLGAVLQAPAATDASRALGAIQQAQQLLSQDAKWRLERDAMFRLLIARAQTLAKNARIKAQIGTVTLSGAKTLEDTLGLVEGAFIAANNNGCTTPDPFARLGGGTCVNGVWKQGPPTAEWQVRGSPTDAEIAGVKARFATAMSNLDVAEVRWDNGLTTDQAMADWLKDALQVLTEVRIGGAPAVDSSLAHTMFSAGNFPNSTPADRAKAQALYELLTGRVTAVLDPAQSVTIPVQTPQGQENIRFVTRSGPNTLADAQLIELLKDTAAIKNDTNRANALLDLSSRFAFTPEMVTLYVAAAKGITSPAEQARVFAQPIRVK